VKTFSFQLLTRSGDYIDGYSTRCYTLAEAQAELRHFIRVNHPGLFDNPAGYGYDLKVAP
jgi:hypothetical protein